MEKDNKILLTLHRSRRCGICGRMKNYVVLGALLLLVTSTTVEADIYDLDALLAPANRTVVTDIYSGTTVTATTRQVCPQREVISIKSSTGSEITGVTKIEPITGKRTTVLNVFQAR